MNQINKKRKVRYGRLVFLIGAAVLIIGGITFAMAKPDKYKEYRNVNEETKLAGSMKKIIQDSEDEKAKFLYYPEFDNEAMNKRILEIVNALPNENGITFLDYESKDVLDKAYTTVKFSYKKLTMDHKVESETITDVNFNNATGAEVSIGDIFRRDYEDVLKADGIDVSDLSKVPFILKDDGVAFQNSDGKEVVINYDTYKNIIKLKGKGIASETLERERTIEVDPDKPMIALTFDDGPSPYTMDFMSVLEANNATATFFMLGQNVVNYPDTVKHMYQQGFEIANHSWDHQDLSGSDRDFIKTEIFDTQDAIYKLVGDEPKQLRPPYGSYSALTSEVAGSGIGIAIWNVDTLDWKSRDTAATLAQARAGVFDGAVILFHDLYPTSLEAIKTLVPELKAQGYQLVTFSDLVKYRGSL